MTDQASLAPAARSGGIALIVALAYFAAALAGFRLSFVAQQVSIVWAPTGIALATLLVFGIRMWPAIWIAAFAVNATTSAPLWTAPVIASGNTCEAVLAAWMLKRYIGFDTALVRVRDVVAFMVAGVGVSTLVSATVGAAALCAGGAQPWARFATIWSDWWLGDAAGALVVAPAIMTVARRDAWPRREWKPLAMLALGAIFVAELVFGEALGARSTHPLEYILFPFIVAAAVRGGPLVTSVVVLCASGVAILGTVGGSGPFAAASLHHGLVLLQAYMGVLAGTGLLLASAMAEREAGRRREIEAARAIVRREQVLRLAQRAGGVAIFEWDFVHQIANCSEEFFRIFGLPPRDGVMTGAEWADFVHPEDRDRMAAHLQSVLAGEAPAVADYRIRTVDGATRWLAYSGQLENTPEGPRLLGTVTDVTPRMESAAALRHAKETAEAANQLKDQFLATLSHELRTPLNVILGYTRMLQAGTIAPDQQRHAIEVIERNAIAQNQLVEDLLDMSRITTGKVRLETDVVQPAAVLGSVLDGVRPAAAAKEIDLLCEIQDDAGPIRGDASRLQQVYWNLLTNAVKFTERGGRIAVRLRAAEGVIETSIEDTGIGIKAEFLPYVFDPFRQADGRLNRDHGGLGLGLAIAKQLVELHGGTIAAVSGGAGRGATFTIRLPRGTGD